MKVAVTGALGALGRHGIRALVEAGHDVVAASRSSRTSALLESLGVEPRVADVFRVDSLVSLYDGADVVFNFAARMPSGIAMARPSLWRLSDRLHTRGVANVVEAARRSGVRRLVQESASFVYADAGEKWITEEDPVGITVATEPLAVAESHVQRFAAAHRAGVVLRLGAVLGDPRGSEVIGFGGRDGWAHVVHAADLASVVTSALHAPSGIYNVGADPVRRSMLIDGLAESGHPDSEAVSTGRGSPGRISSGRISTGLGSSMIGWLAGPRLEPMSRSLRVCSEHFTAQTGWAPQHPEFDESWLQDLAGTAGGVGQ